jgi:hypothetical protein
LEAAKRQNLSFKLEITALKEQVAELTRSHVPSHKESESGDEYDVVFDVRYKTSEFGSV